MIQEWPSTQTTCGHPTQAHPSLSLPVTRFRPLAPLLALAPQALHHPAQKDPCLAFLALHDSAIRWPSEDEKEESKKWVEMVSCYEWQDGYCMVDGTPIVLFQKPGYYGEAYFDRKSNYSLNLQVRLTSIPCACICYNSDSLLPCQIFA